MRRIRNPGAREKPAPRFVPATLALAVDPESGEPLLDQVGRLIVGRSFQELELVPELQGVPYNHLRYSRGNRCPASATRSTPSSSSAGSEP